MITPTKSIFLLAGTAWTAEYTGAAEPDASTPAWTLTGTDHATAADGALTIESAGTDLCAYHRAITSTPSALWVFARASAAAGMPSSVAGLALHLNGKRTFAYLDPGDDGGILSGLRDDATADLFYRGAPISSGTATTTSTDTMVQFGKTVATDSDVAQVWDYVAYAEGSCFASPWPPAGWSAYDAESKQVVNTAYDGTEEILHQRVDRRLAFTLQSLNDSQLLALWAFYNDHAKDGSPFRVYRDASALDTCDSLVVRWDGPFRPRKKQGNVYDVAVRCKVVA